MKKTIIAIASVMLFVACNGSSESNSTDSVTTDSTVVVDTLTNTDSVGGGQSPHGTPIK